MKCVLNFVCDVCCTSKNPLLVGEGVLEYVQYHESRQIRCMAINSGRTCWHQACPLQMMCGIQMRSAADVRELDIQWVVHRIVWDQMDYREVCARWVPKNPTVDDKTHCMGLYGPFLYPLEILH
jgi:hypothetical protein